MSAKYLVILESLVGDVRGHFAPDIMAKKVLVVGVWWRTLHKDVKTYCKQCDFRQKTGRLTTVGYGTTDEHHTTRAIHEMGVRFCGAIQTSNTKEKQIHTGGHGLCNQMGGGSCSKGQLREEYCMDHLGQHHMWIWVSARAGDPTRGAVSSTKEMS